MIPRRPSLETVRRGASFRTQVGLLSFIVIFSSVAIAEHPVTCDDGAEKLYAKGITALDGGHFEAALAAFSEMKADNDAMKVLVGRQSDRASTVLALADHLPRLLGEKPLSARPLLHFVDGTAGKLTRVDGDSIYVIAEDKTEASHPPRTLEAPSLLALSGHVRLTPDDALGRAFLATLCKDKSSFDSAILIAASNATLKNRVDSALAFQRGLDDVPPGGFTRLGESWQTQEELATSAIADELRTILPRLHSAKEPEVESAKARLEELEKKQSACVVRAVQVCRDLLRTEFDAAPEQKKLAQVNESLVKIAAARHFALELINDEVKYFYPHEPPDCPPSKAREYPAVEAEVEKRVAALRLLWGDEHGPLPAFVVRPSARFVEVVSELQALRRILLDAGAKSEAGDPTLVSATLLPADAPAIHVRNVALDLTSRDRLLSDVDTMAKDRSILASEKDVTPDEKQEFELTNEYRAMFGRRQLLFNMALRKIALSHSRWMLANDKEGHTEDPGSPTYNIVDRITIAGYAGANFRENATNEGSSAAAAHHAWIVSSGHHRTVLSDEMTDMGLGRAGRYWTQDFIRAPSPARKAK